MFFVGFLFLISWFYFSTVICILVTLWFKIKSNPLLRMMNIFSFDMYSSIKLNTHTPGYYFVLYWNLLLFRSFHFITFLCISLTRILFVSFHSSTTHTFSEALLFSRSRSLSFLCSSHVCYTHASRHLCLLCVLNCECVKRAFYFVYH